MTTTNAAGEFSLAVANGTLWEIEVRGAPQTRAWQTVYVARSGVLAGTQGLVLTTP